MDTRSLRHGRSPHLVVIRVLQRLRKVAATPIDIVHLISLWSRSTPGASSRIFDVTGCSVAREVKATSFWARLQQKPTEHKSYEPSREPLALPGGTPSAFGHGWSDQIHKCHRCWQLTTPLATILFPFGSPGLPARITPIPASDTEPPTDRQWV